MDDDPEGLEVYLDRVVRRLVERLVEDQRVPQWGVLENLDPACAARYPQLAEIRMAVQVRKALDKHLGFLITHGSVRMPDALISEVLPQPEGVTKLTWKMIGDALGVSAQAAHRKYGHSLRGWH